MMILHMERIRTNDILGNDMIVDSLQPNQPAAPKGGPPRRLLSNVCAERIVVNYNHRVQPHCGESPKGRPEKGCWRNVARHVVLRRSEQGVAEENDEAPGGAILKEEIKSNAIRRRQARDPLAVGSKKPLAIFPSEDNSSVPRGKRRRGKESWLRHATEWCGAGNGNTGAATDQGERPNEPKEPRAPTAP